MLTYLLNAGRVTGELRADVTAEDIAASLIGIFTVARPPEHDARASRLLNILMDGLRPPCLIAQHLLAPPVASSGYGDGGAGGG
jgi:hypothetical protein